ncbi:synaptic vesicle membrane protein VAT-1 homolog [Patiria miniata]|uniref:Enoyl reductase (ER) domain-containing protein n=1 Tax=Patiria miniata TaxID=46514 RepID=A0A913YZG9_PATMI|nr:synaptic vesicle membrane protein VAT-1 homolog [Patiria miniata]
MEFSKIEDEKCPEKEDSGLAIQDDQLTMKEMQLLAFGGYGNFKMVQTERPKVASGQVLVKVVACGINFADVSARQGLYNGPTGAPSCPAVLGMEGSGVIIQVGEGVQELTVGNRVMFITMFGAWRECVALPANHCFKISDTMTFQDAAAIPVNYLTAYLMLFEFGNLRKGKSVLIHMAAGGVGWAAAQLCQTVPDVTVFGTASAHKHDIIKKNGVHHPIDYHTKDYVQEVKQISPSGVDIVLDPLAGADTKKGYSLLRPLGKIIVFGGANIIRGEMRSMKALVSTWWNTPNFKPFDMMVQNKAVCGFHLGYLEKEVDLLHNAVHDIMKMYQEGQVKPHVDSVWEMSKVGAAMQHIQERKNVGKVILTWDDTTAKR